MNYDKFQRKLYQNLILAKKYDNFHDKYLKKAITQLKSLYNHVEKQINTKGNKAKIPYVDLLITERISLDVFDVNISNTNIKLVDRKLVSCDTAIQEAKIFENDKTLYKQNFIESRVKNINAPTAVSRGTKDILVYLGREQQGMEYDKTKPLNDFIEARKDILRLVAREFKKERENLLMQDNSNQLSINQNKEKNQNRGYTI